MNFKFSQSARAQSPAPRADVLRTLTIFNSVLLLVLWTMATFVAERHWFTAMLTYFPQQIYGLPTLYILGWSLWRRHMLWTAINLGVITFFLFQFLGLNIPLRAASTLNAPQSQRSLRVVNYNIFLGLRGDTALAEVIRSQHADIICLQEATHKTGYPDPVETIHAALPGWFLARGEEVATLSRFPILSQELHEMPRPSRRQILETVLDVNGERITVLNVHLNTLQFRSYPDARTISQRLTLSNRQRNGQAETLNQVAAKISTPLLLCGDFNTPPRGMIYQRLARRYQDAFRAAGWGFGYSFHSDIPVLRIDYIWTDQHFTTQRCFVLKSSASDHRPVIADLSF